MRRTLIIVVSAMLVVLGAATLTGSTQEVGRDPGELISLDFKDGKLTDVLPIFAEIAGLTVAIELGAQLDQRVTFKADQITWAKALDQLLEQVQLRAERVGEFIIVRGVD